MPTASRISARQPASSWRWAANGVRRYLAALCPAVAGSGFLALFLAVAPVNAQAPDCQAILTRLTALLDLYAQPATEAINRGEDPYKVLDEARARLLKGDTAASVTMVGVGLILHGRRDVLPVSLIRQICTFSQRSTLPLHVAGCAYLSALNPLGDRDEKRRLTEAEIARFETLYGREDADSNGKLAGHVQALKACLP